MTSSVAATGTASSSAGIIKSTTTTTKSSVSNVAGSTRSSTTTITKDKRLQSTGSNSSSSNKWFRIVSLIGLILVIPYSVGVWFSISDYYTEWKIDALLEPWVDYTLHNVPFLNTMIQLVDNKFYNDYEFDNNVNENTIDDNNNDNDNDGEKKLNRYFQHNRRSQIRLLKNSASTTALSNKNNSPRNKTNRTIGTDSLGGGTIGTTDDNENDPVRVWNYNDLCFQKMYDIVFQNNILDPNSNSNTSMTTLEELLIQSPYHNIILAIHRNGEAQPCSSSGNRSTSSITEDEDDEGGIRVYDIITTLYDIVQEYVIEHKDDNDVITKQQPQQQQQQQQQKYLANCPVVSIFEQKYSFESLLTQIIHNGFSSSSCNSIDSEDADVAMEEGFYGYCDMGEERTPILTDHHNLEPIEIEIESFQDEEEEAEEEVEADNDKEIDATNENVNTNVEDSADNNNDSRTMEYLPCHFHNVNGIRINSLSKFIELLQMSIRSSSSEEVDSLVTKTNAMTTKDCTSVVVNPDGTTTTTTRSDGSDCIRPTDAHDVNNYDENDNNNTIKSTTIEMHLYAVPAGRVFIHAPAYIGQIIQLPHVIGGNPNIPVYMKVISLQPKVFDIFNFFTQSENEDILHRVLTETKETHRIKRSSTGASGYNLNERRTSETGFDTDGATAVKVKKRCFNVLGFDSYIESHADGLQILRYNQTKAYIPHMDWIDGNDQLQHDYESGQRGGNRFATILLYFTDLEKMDGGETVFTEAWPVDVPENERKDLQTALKELRESPQGSILKKNSWEETMVAKCRSRLAIRPQSTRAVLFYSQLPNGKPDPKSFHGGCPVLNGTKYAANLWVWNTPRDGYPGNPKNPKYKGTKTDDTAGNDDGIAKVTEDYPGRVTGTFRNSGTDPTYERAELYYIDQFWGKIGFGDPPISVNTYPGHVWNVKVNGITKTTFEIKSSEPSVQEHVV